MRRLAIANVSYLYSADTVALSEIEDSPGYRVSACTHQQLKEQAIRSHCKVSDQDLAKLKSGAFGVFGAFRDGTLVAFAWTTLGDVDACSNHDGKPETGLPICLASDAAYIFNVYVSPEHRGYRLYAALISHSAQILRAQGIKRFVLATEGTNTNALRSVERMGFKKVAYTSFFKLGPLCKAKYPALPQDCGFTIGAYAGDLRAAKPNLS